MPTGLEESLQPQITSADLAVGSHIPSEAELVSPLGVSRPAVDERGVHSCR